MSDFDDRVDAVVERMAGVLLSTGTAATTTYVSIPEGRRIRGRVKELIGTGTEPDAVHSGEDHSWREMLHLGRRGTGFAECLCGAIGVPYRLPRPTR